MSHTPRKKPKHVVELEVQRTQRLTPQMIRVVLGGKGISDFRDNNDSDRYVKLLFPPDGVHYPEPFNLEQIERDFPRDQQPVKRTYTVRRFDPQAGELTIDFVYHGDAGIAGPWAAAAQPGDKLRLLGPGGKYSPSEEADWHLFVGDESAIPAIASSLERLAPGAQAHVILQVEDPQEVQTLACAAQVEFTWLYRCEAGGDNPRSALVDAVTNFEFPPGQGHLFVHGEAETIMKRIRPHLLKERCVNRDWLSISGYWRLGNTEERFRQWKAAERTTITA